MATAIENYEQLARKIDTQLTSSFESHSSRSFALFNARAIDASGIHEGFWLVVRDGLIHETGWDGVDTSAFTELEISRYTAKAFEQACERANIAPHLRFNAQGKTLVPGFVDIHSHGGWGMRLTIQPRMIPQLSSLLVPVTCTTERLDRWRA